MTWDGLIHLTLCHSIQSVVIIKKKVRISNTLLQANHVGLLSAFTPFTLLFLSCCQKSATLVENEQCSATLSLQVSVNAGNWWLSIINEPQPSVHGVSIRIPLDIFTLGHLMHVNKSNLKRASKVQGHRSVTLHASQWYSQLWGSGVLWLPFGSRPIIFQSSFSLRAQKCWVYFSCN